MEKVYWIKAGWKMELRTANKCVGMSEKRVQKMNVGRFRLWIY